LPPVALYPDPVIATLLPASVYPLEIVQAARFVADTNNLARLDAQPWDENVKAVARIPAVIKQMNDDLDWTMQLGEAFLAQDKDVMDAIQAMRAKAQQAGTLQTSPQQIVTVTNMIVETRVEQQVVVVTNTVVQIQPANPQVVYVPTYNPYYVYYPPPAYVANPYPLLTFGAGVAVGAIIANNCDWYHGGCYHGYHGGGSININGDVNINRGNINTGNIGSGNRPQQQKWQPNQSRLSTSGSATANATASARGYGSGGATAARPSTGAVSPGSRPSTGVGSAATRPTTGAATRPATTTPARPATTTAARPATTPAARPTTAQSRPTTAPSVNRAPSGGGSAFGGVNNGSASRNFSSRGATSRGGGFSGGGGRGGGGRR
jgi:hypothetical protein